MLLAVESLGIGADAEFRVGGLIGTVLLIGGLAATFWAIKQGTNRMASEDDGDD